MRVFALRPSHPSAGRVYQPATLPEREAARPSGAHGTSPAALRPVGVLRGGYMRVRASTLVFYHPDSPVRANPRAFSSPLQPPWGGTGGSPPPASARLAEN